MGTPPPSAPSEPRHAFVDETKRRGFSLIRCDVPVGDLNEVRSELRRLLRSNQRRIHFYKESNAVRDTLLRIIRTSAIQTTVFSSDLKESHARQMCIEAMALDCVKTDIAVLTIESDETQRARDAQTIQPISAQSGAFAFRHMGASAEPGLWLPDAIGWCLGHPDRRWHSAAAELVTRRVEVPYKWREPVKSTVRKTSGSLPAAYSDRGT